MLRDLCDQVQYGYTASARTEAVGPKFLRITDVVPQRIEWNTVPYCEIEQANSNKYLLHEGDIVIARTGATTGYAKYLKKPPHAVFASYLVRLRLKDGMDKRYIGFIIESEEYKRFIHSNIGGSAQPNANAQILTSFPVHLPAFEVQYKIASILSAYDDLIENNNRRIKILEEMAQIIYREWFVNFRFPGHQKVKMVKSELGMIPEGWAVEKLGDVCNILMGQSPKSEFYNTTGDGLPFHQGVKDFGRRFPTHITYCTVDNRIAETGGILLSVRAPVGRINIANTKIIIGRGLSAIRYRECLQSFLYYQLKEIFSEEDKMGSGAIFNAVTKDDLHKIKFKMPDNELDKKFNALIEPIDKTIELLTSKNEILHKTRDLLLPKLISGEIDVENLDIKQNNLEGVV